MMVMSQDPLTMFIYQKPNISLAMIIAIYENVLLGSSEL